MSRVVRYYGYHNYYTEEEEEKVQMEDAADLRNGNTCLSEIGDFYWTASRDSRRQRLFYCT